MKIIFFRYILTQKENSLIYRFLIARKNDYRKGDWYSKVKKILNEFKINMADEDIKATPDSLDLVQKFKFWLL